MKKYLLILTTFLVLQGGKMTMEVPQKFETAIFVGGCFWCLQSAFEKLNGIEKVIGG